VFSWHDGSKLILCSGASLCLILSAPGASAEPNIPDAATLTADLKSPLSSLKEAQDVYSKELGMVSAMPGGSLAPQEKAAKALEEIRWKVLQIAKSDKVPGDLMKDTLVAISEAQTALLTDGAQTIAYSLGTVGEEIKAIEAKLQPGNAAQKAQQMTSSEPAKQEPQQQSAQAKPDQQPQQMAANEPKHEANPQQAQMQQEAQKAENKPAGAGQPSNEPAAKPSTAQTAQPSPDQQASVANRQRSDLVGKMLFDRAGDEVAKIQDVKTTGDGKIAAAEIDVGGFLGIGSHRIAVPADQLEMKGDKVQAKSLTEQQIKNLPQEAR
jgi:hypothetical protein